MKTCKGCLKALPLEAFCKRADAKDGRAFKCRDCKRQIDDRWRAANVDRKRAIGQAYYAANKEKHNADCAVRYAANRERYRAKNLAWIAANQERYDAKRAAHRLANIDTKRARRRQHYRDNKSRYVAQARSREERVRRATPPWADFEKIAAFYELAPLVSEETGVLHHVDHVVPLRGRKVSGLHVHTNLQVLPALDNLRKSNRAF